MIYFTADLHFGHRNVLKYCQRPFSDTDEMDAVLIENWNDTVQTDDSVYILGDISMRGPTYVNQVLAKLHGKKHLILGNHDGYAKKQEFNPNLLSSISHYKELHFQDRWFIMMHYPILEWNHQFHGSIQLHGHIHAVPRYNRENSEKGLFRFDVGVDANAYCPVSAYTVLAWASGAQMQVDHHYRDN